MKKSIISVILITVMLLSVLTFTSCEDGEKVDSINGKQPAEAFNEALTSLESTRNYEIEIDMEFDVKVVGLSVYGVEIDDFFIYAYDGDNEYYALAENAESTLAEYDMQKLVAKSDDEVWYVDGVCYVKDGDEKEKFEAEKSPIKRSNYELALSEIVEENLGETQCYLDEDRYYFTVTITNPDEMKLKMGADEEYYKVYLTADGGVDEIVVECKVKTFGVVKMTVDYSYGEASISAPSDAADYKER